MTVRPYRVLTGSMLLAAVLASGPAPAKVIEGGPQSLSGVSSIGESLRRAGQNPLHILYVHGIGATSAGGSRAFQKAICAFLKDCTAPATAVERDYADSGVFAGGAGPPMFAYLGRPVWRSRDDWSASAPFVDHYVLRRTDGGPLVVDEINWWPLALPLKCRAIVTSESRLAGSNIPLLDFCSQPAQPDAANPGRFRAYTWISPDAARRLKTSRPQGALINRWFKNSILDWGFSDAMMAVGSLHGLFREGMRQLFLKSVIFNARGSKANDWEQQWKDPHGIDREFVVVSHSLGSYLVFSALNLGLRDAAAPSRPLPPEGSASTEDAAAQYILERTSLVYFFANQIPLLELANLRGAGPVESTSAQPLTPEAAQSALNKMLAVWRDLRKGFAARNAAGAGSAPGEPQVIAWSDPSDLLSWRLPAMQGLSISNLYVRNTQWHWIIANPVAAHANYATNKEVLRIMFRPQRSGGKGKAGRQ